MPADLNFFFHAITSNQHFKTAYETFGIGVSGAFGGLVYGTARLLEDGKQELDGTARWKATNGVPLRWFLSGQIVVGSGGAFAAVLAILTIGNAVAGNTQSLTNFPLFEIALCVVGGFMGNKLLMAVGNNLKKQLTSLEDSVNKAEQTSNKAEETANIAVNRADTATKDAADAKFRSDMTIDILIAKDQVASLERCHEIGHPIEDELRSKAEDSRKKMAEYAKRFPTDRSPNIVLANLAFELGDGPAAIEQLQLFLEMRRSAKIEEDDPDASGWFNIACFNSRIGAESDPSESDKFRKNALDALTRCFTIAERGGPQRLQLQVSKAQKDPDLEFVRKTNEFRILVEQFVLRTSASASSNG